MFVEGLTRPLPGEAFNRHRYAPLIARFLRHRAAARHNGCVEMSTRQSFVLRKVVEGHRDTGQPVGSRWLAEQVDVPWGPSTIRAELARLEELGLLQHPHTSAGRVPTDHGYRRYVDELLEDGGAALDT